VGAPRGPLGQVPAGCRLVDCCDYARSNGLNHLSSFARAMDVEQMLPITDALLRSRHIIFVDLGSGASLTWILAALVAKKHGRTQTFQVVNVDHAPNMHRVSRSIEMQFHSLLKEHAPRYERRQLTRPEGINGFTSSEVEDNPTVFLVLNHLLHQNNSTNLPVPDFVNVAIEMAHRTAKSARSLPMYGISLEPARLNSGFGQKGLSQVVRAMGGTMTESAWVAGDRVGKSVSGFEIN
jgi:hypothetical protein